MKTRAIPILLLILLLSMTACSPLQATVTLNGAPLLRTERNDGEAAMTTTPAEENVTVKSSRRPRRPRPTPTYSTPCWRPSWI